MAARLEEDNEPKECANCAATEALALCSRCHGAYFCSAKCQKAYWPFHKTYCKRNEFADSVEEREPRFARWLRKHGKQAQLKDDEVDRIERASKAACGPSRQEVMDSMYNRLNPKPKEPTYSLEERRRMKEQDEQLALEARQIGAEDKVWKAIEVPAQLGQASEEIKWMQDQARVEVFLRLPHNCLPKHVVVQLSKSHVDVRMGGRAVLCGELCQEIKVSDSHWFIVDGILHFSLLKLARRGNFYGRGKTNADTFWRSVLRGAPDALAIPYPPSEYYHSVWEPAEGAEPPQPPARIKAS